MTRGVPTSSAARATTAFVVDVARRARYSRAMASSSTSTSANDDDFDDGFANGENSQDDLYAVLGLDRAERATYDDKAIKRAFHVAALAAHPDKNVGRDDFDANASFAAISRAYDVLRDRARRREYDDYGTIESDDLATAGDASGLRAYYRSVYKRAATEDIAEFESTYRGSDEERKDVVGFYVKFRGDMTKVFAWVMCSEEADDSHRFADIADAAIEAGEATEYEVYARWAKEVRKKKAPKDPLGARKVKTLKSSKGGDGALMALIQRNQVMRGDQADDMFAALEAKYAPKKKTKK